ncbi:MAG: hypothetical protein AAFR93_07210, partial [Pseudomonadota bacterium]
ESRMSHLVLHIGTHKTGTTHIQNTLFANRTQLLAHGLCYPKIGRASGQHVLTTQWIKTLPDFYASRTSAVDDWASITPEQETVLLSSEEFSRAGPDRVNFTELAELARGFTQTTIICVLRTPIDFLQSSYLEVIKKRDCAPIGTFVQEVMDPGTPDPLHYDPNPLLDQLQAQVPSARLVFLPYEATRRGPGGLVGGVLAAAGCSIAPEALTKTATAKANISAPVLSAWMAHQISRPAPAGPGLIDLATQALAPSLGETSPRLFTQAEHVALHDHFAPCIARFERRVRVFAPEFQADPFPPLTGRFGRDDVPATAWARYARLIHDARRSTGVLAALSTAA